MINCSIHNYKEWIGAYIDGSLSREDMLTAESFLQQHSHLMDQYLEELETFSLNPDPIDPPSFSGLEIVITPTYNIHENNFSDHFISYHEGLLSAIEKTEVNEFLQSNPRLKNEFAAYGATKLNANLAVQFPDKKSLYKKSRPAIPLFGRIAAAASVLLIVGLYVLWPSTQQKDGIALKDSTKPNIPSVNISNDGLNNDQNNSFVQNDVKEKKKLPVHLNNQTVQVHESLALVDMNTNTPVVIGELAPSIEGVQPEMALQDIKSTIPVMNDEVADNKPKKKGLFNKLFSGEKTYIEDYINATFTALGDDKEDDKWVLKVDRDKDGKSKRVKFSSPLFSIKTGN